MVDIYLLITFLSSILNLFLGALVFSRGIKKSSNIVFFLMTISTTAWVVSVYLSDYFKLPEKALLFIKLANISATWAIYLFLFFTFIFPKEFGELLARLKICYIIFPIIFSVLFFNKWIISNVEIETWGSNPRTGKLVVLYVAYLFATILFGISNLVRKYIKSTGIEKNQLKFISFGLILTIISAILFNAAIPLITGSARSTKLAPATTIFFLFFTFLAITRYHLFGIEVILTEILVGVIGILLVVQIFTAPSTLWRIVNGGIFVLYCIFGYLLIRGVFREIRRREEVEKISQAKSEFISITSHQLRTPLSAIKGYLSMVLEGTYGGISERVKKVLENVYQSNERLIKLVNSFLDVSRIELGREELKLERVSIEDLISETVSEMEIEAKKKNLYLKFEKPKIALPKILIDRGRIKEVISNLIDNAIKYTQKGGITIKSQISNGKCQISISDTGEGLTKEEISRLFESFSRGTAGAKFWTEGVGLGLYVSRKFVELHGGKIWAESEGKGKGSTFYIELPIK
jgi:signal transduction histidine kinase